MSLTDRIPYVKASDVNQLAYFDYVDRVIVFSFMTLSTTSVFFVLGEHATEADMEALREPILFGGGVFDMLGWMLIGFLFWPFGRIVLLWAMRLVDDVGKRTYQHVREARR